MVRTALLLQSAYFVVTGAWPLLHRRSFEAVTGPKPDFWLVRVAGALITVIGATLALAVAGSDRPPRDSVVLASASAMSLAWLELAEVARGRISRIYAADAVVEGVLMAMLFGGLARSRAD
jgi:hypothetical protein